MDFLPGPSLHSCHYVTNLFLGVNPARSVGVVGISFIPPPFEGAANRVLAHRSLTTNSRRVSRLLARTLDLNFPETAEITSSPRPLSPSTSTNKEARSQKQSNQRQAPNTLRDEDLGMRSGAPAPSIQHLAQTGSIDCRHLTK
ncbi:hypothetical protein TNCV_4406981 [Trichonephila clavipes]|nr:hypothetical protein TNCV_4406981 [Trichonephila clavipes]